MSVGWMSRGREVLLLMMWRTNGELVDNGSLGALHVAEDVEEKQRAWRNVTCRCHSRQADLFVQNLGTG